MAFFGLGKKKGDSGGNTAPMPKTSNSPPAAIDPDAKLEFDDKSKNSARKWFAQAKKLTEDRNYDYALESFLSGLKFWPEAVEEGHIPLRVAAYVRREKGGAKPSTLEAMKHPMSGKDSLVAMLNAEWLWSRDPGNLSYMEGIVKNATKAGCEETLLFIGPIYFEAAKNEKKTSKDRFVLLRKLYEETGARCERRGDYPKALSFFQGALTVLQILQNIGGSNLEYSQELTDLATKITIIKGKYDSSDDFRGSIKDSKAQKDLHDKERLVMDDRRLAEMVAAAKKEWQENPSVQAKLYNLVNLLCKSEDPAGENEAIDLLEQEYASSQNYGVKMRADDIRIKQLRRQVRQISAQNDVEALKQSKLDLLRLELKVYRERVQKHPTDNALKFDYGKQLMQARKFDEAIPILQEARNDPKNRIHCLNLIGRCFFEKSYHAQAATTYRQAIEEYELEGDEVSKELHYWLGRAGEAGGQNDDARKAYGQLIQWDYNYKDVRRRLDALAPKPQP